ncbi:unnamed protein product [Rotaria magnacalcarata]|uniref:Uncharacterized protein n=4 Tax=Rotaria magnacalcarata TaxID=392030 RepID=A0A816TAD2_9BILA|nr:unnamed protein product [Rotaria magnacalcarata]CAF2108994.1 unnamed protein product [Rotaria magnacalcarata]CAF3776697.1 unnamed protein product [Rotaria magnacalcarata]
MTSSSKDYGNTNRDDCQIHVDKEGESCVIKIESVGQEKVLKELLNRFNSLKSEVDQFLVGQEKQQQPKEMINAIQDIAVKLKPLEDQLQKVNKYVGDDHLRLNKLHNDLNKKFDEIKQDVNTFKEQQKNIVPTKDIIDKILQKIDNIDKILKISHNDEQKNILSELEYLKQQIPTKTDLKSTNDAVQALQICFDKEKTKPDILARKLDGIDQKLKETHPEHMTLMKDMQSKIDPIHKTIPQTNDTLSKINDRVKAIHVDTMKLHPDIIKKLNDIDHHVIEQHYSIIEPMKQFLNEKLNPFIEQQTKNDGEQKLGSPNISERDNDSNSPNRVPLCINGMIPVLNKLSDPNVLQALASDIEKKLSDIQTKLSSSDELQRKQNDFIGNISKQHMPLMDQIKSLVSILDKLKQQHDKDSENLNRELDKSFQPITQKLNDLFKQQDLLKNLDSKLSHLSKNIEKENDLKRRTDAQPDISKEISLRTQPLQQALDNLSKQQQPLLQTIYELPKQLNDIHQSQIHSNTIKDVYAKLDPLTQSIKAIKDGLDQQTQNKDRDNQTLMNIEKKLNQTLNDSPKRPDVSQDIEKALHPFSQIIKTLKDNIELSQAQQQTEKKKLDRLEQTLSKSLDSRSQTSDIINPMMDKLNEIIKNLKQKQQTDPMIKNLSDDIQFIRTFLEKQTISDNISSKITEIVQNIKVPLEIALKDIYSKTESTQQISNDLTDIKTKNDDIMHKIDKLIVPLSNVNSQVQNITEKIEQIQPKQNSDLSKKTSSDLINTLRKLDDQMIKQEQTNKLLNDMYNQLTHLNNNLPILGSLKAVLDKFKEHDDNNNNNNDSSKAIKNIHDQLKTLDQTIKGLPYQILSESKRSSSYDERTNADNLRRVPLSQPIAANPNNSIASLDVQAANLFTSLLTLQTTIQCSDKFLCQHIPQYFKRIEQSSLVQSDRDLQELVKCVKDRCLNNDSDTMNSNVQNDPNKTFTNQTSPLNIDINNNLVEQYSHTKTSDNNINRTNENRMPVQLEYLTKSRYILFISEQSIRDNWPNLSPQATSIIEKIINQPFEFDHGTNIDHLIQQNNLEQYASLARNAIKKSDKDYDKLCYMMDSIVFDKMTMIGCREALIRPWNASLLNQASSTALYPYPSGNNSQVERFHVNKDISLWMVETDDKKPYNPTEFMPNIARLNDKYDKIQQPQFNEIRQKRREDETRWNERYAFTKDNRRILFVNDLRSYFMDYDTKRKYQVHDDVPINPVCRTGIAGRGDLPFWGPNHCVVVILLRNINDPEVVLMKHHGDAHVLPKGFYGHEARYDNQIKIIQDPVSGQILPPNLLEYWWLHTVKLNEMNHSIKHLKRILNDKELKEEFAEVFSQKGCNKSVFDNGYVDHPLNTDHAWVESSVWKIQFKDWRIPEMKSAKYAIADDLKNSNNNTFPFVWIKLIDALLIVPDFDRGILVDVLATGMPL